MFELELLHERLVDLIRRTVCTLPEGSVHALEAAYAREEEGSVAKAHIGTTLTNLRLSQQHQIPLCADTGLPVFFLRIGRDFESIFSR